MRRCVLRRFPGGHIVHEPDSGCFERIVIFMQKKSFQVSANQLVGLFLAAVILGGIILFSIIYMVQNGIPKFGVLALNSRTMPINTINYQDAVHYVNSRVSIQGYVIVTNDTKNICGSSGWDTCKTWFSYDPLQGLGPLTVKITVGKGPDSITEAGVMYDHTGARLKLIQTDQYSWYHAQVVGLVEQCKGAECIIDVDTVYALP